MKPKPETEIRNQNRNPKVKPKSETEIGIETESETGIGIEEVSGGDPVEGSATVDCVTVPLGEDLLDIDKIKELISRIVEVAQELDCSMLELSKAAKSIYVSSNALMGDKLIEYAAKHAHKGSDAL